MAEKENIFYTLTEYCQRHGYTLETEKQFIPPRLFRIDYFIPEISLGVEYEGIVAGKSRHTTITGYTRDCDKYNIATMMGITMLRLTVLNHKSLSSMLDTFGRKNNSDFSLHIKNFAVSLLHNKKGKKSCSKSKPKKAKLKSATPVASPDVSGSTTRKTNTWQSLYRDSLKSTESKD